MLSRPLKPVQGSLEVAGAEGTQGVERRESVHQACTFFSCVKAYRAAGTTGN